jgi:hypothetical protein
MDHSVPEPWSNDEVAKANLKRRQECRGTRYESGDPSLSLAKFKFNASSLPLPD